MGAEIIAAIIAGIAALTAAGISAGASASSAEELRGGQMEAAALAQREMATQERQTQLKYGLEKQKLELGSLGLREQARQAKRAEDRLTRQEKRQNMASLYTKTNNFLNEAITRDNRLSILWG